MYFIAQDIETHRYYVLNAEEGTIEGIADTEEQCRQRIKYMTFHDFYYSVMMDDNHHLYPASGWWERPIIPTIGDPFDLDRFIDCTTFYAPLHPSL